MGKLRFLLAMAAAKMSIVVLKLFGRNASCTPGKVALLICKDFLGYLTPPKTVIAVTGTNGKTTVSNLVASILTNSGYTVTNNGLGSNVQAGVATALLQDATLTGKPTKDIAVLEVDERSSLRIYPYIKPDYLLCNNIMRDSIRRNAHTDFISYIINRALPETTALVLNADDLICATLGPNNHKRIYFGMDAEKTDCAEPPYARDIVYCPKCGEALIPEYIRYSHIGRMSCSGCDFASPTPDFLLTNIDRDNGTFTVRHNEAEQTFHLINDNVVNLYNFCGIIALLTSVGLSYEQIASGFEHSKIISSRFDHINTGKHNIIMQLAKGQNPIANARCYNYVANCPGENKTLILVGDNIEPSESTCWLYDCEYSYLKHPSITKIIFSGPRCKDQYLRALIAGVSPEKMAQISDPTAGTELLDLEKTDDIYILYGPYMIKEANIVKQKLLQLTSEEAGK